MKALLSQIFGRQLDKPANEEKRFGLPVGSEYRPPACRTLDDLCRLVLGEPTEEEKRGFQACLEAIREFPESFIALAVIKAAR